MPHSDSSGGDPLPRRPNASDFGNLLVGFRPRLRRMVTLRLDPRLTARIDASDIVQDAYMEVSRRMEDYEESGMPFYLWVRQITTQKLIDFHRKNLGAARRDVRQEVPLSSPGLDSSVALANAIARDSSSPSRRAIRHEYVEILTEALLGLKEIDREVLLLRHFEALTFSECAEVLGIEVGAAKVRHLRAAERLGVILRRHGGDGEYRVLPT